MHLVVILVNLRESMTNADSFIKLKNNFQTAHH